MEILACWIPTDKKLPPFESMYFSAQLLFIPGLLQNYKARRLVTDDREIRLIQRYRDDFWMVYFSRGPMVSECPFLMRIHFGYCFLQNGGFSKFHFSKTILIEAVR